LCGRGQYKRQRIVCFFFRARAEKGIARHLDVSSVVGLLSKTANFQSDCDAISGSKLTSAQIHRKKKDGGCTFYHNTLRTKLSLLGMCKDMV